MCLSSVTAHTSHPERTDDAPATGTDVRKAVMGADK